MWELPIPYSILPISKACAECGLDRDRLSGNTVVQEEVEAPPRTCQQRQFISLNISGGICKKLCWVTLNICNIQSKWGLLRLYDEGCADFTADYSETKGTLIHTEQSNCLKTEWDRVFDSQRSSAHSCVSGLSPCILIRHSTVTLRPHYTPINCLTLTNTL